MFHSSRIIRLSEVDSTNTYLLRLASQKTAKNGDIVLTKSQTKGRGQMGNVWESEPGKNLNLSLYFVPAGLAVDRQFQVSKFISLAIAGMLKEYVEKVCVKWPNDIYVENKKIAGILIENSISGSGIQYMIAGLGININQFTFTSGAPNPVSLAHLLKQEIVLESALRKLIRSLNRWHEVYRFRQTHLDREYLDNLYLFNQWHNYKLPAGKSFKGKIKGVDQIGQLRIETESGEEKVFGFKEVEF